MKTPKYKFTYKRERQRALSYCYQHLNVFRKSLLTLCSGQL
jgi:hypothetical protein